jgi:Uma2 family endonuclease
MAIETPPMVEVRKLTLDDVLGMVAAEIIAETERVELVDGVLVTMSPEGVRHVQVVTWLNRVMTDTYPAPIEVRVNLTRPLEGPYNFRVPDLLVVHPVGPTRWADPGDVILAVEVSLTSLRGDLGPKAADYARWGVPVYWVVDLVHDTLVVHSEPSGDGFRSVTRCRGRDAVRFPDSDRVVPAADLFERPT